MDPERRRVAAVPLWTDTETVRSIEQLFLDRVDDGVRIRTTKLSQERLLRENRRFLEGAADSHAGDQRRASVGAGGPDALQHPFLRPLDPVGGCQHLVL